MRKIVKNVPLILILFLATFVPSSVAVSAGVSPPNITINDATPGGIYTVNFSVYNLGNESTEYSISSNGDVGNWTVLGQDNVNLKQKTSSLVGAKITVPSNIVDGVYKGNILIKSIPKSSVTNNKVSIGVNLPVVLNVVNPPQMYDITFVAVVFAIIGAVVLILLKRGKKHESI